MIGIVIVTHGQLASDLVSAARNIVGPLHGIEAVSIGWSDDVGTSRDAIASALGKVMGTEGEALILTDMFGGTPTNLSLPFLSRRVEIVTGVNLPMLIKLVGSREGPLRELAQLCRDQGRGAISVASEILEKTK